MNYRINTYDKKYIMVDITEIFALGDLEKISNKTYKITLNIYLAWLKLLEENNKVSTSEIALHKDNPLKKYLTTKLYIKTEEDRHIYLYEDEEIKEIEVTPKVKIRRK